VGEPAGTMGATMDARRGMHPVARHALAIVLVALALIVSLALQNSFGNPFWFFFSVAVIVDTWFDRTGPGWLAVVCSTLAVMYYFTPPLHSFAVSEGLFQKLAAAENSDQLPRDSTRHRGFVERLNVLCGLQQAARKNLQVVAQNTRSPAS
jgi:hypothetical protein